VGMLSRCKPDCARSATDFLAKLLDKCRRISQVDIAVMIVIKDFAFSGNGGTGSPRTIGEGGPIIEPEDTVI